MKRPTIEAYRDEVTAAWEDCERFAFPAGGGVRPAWWFKLHQALGWGLDCLEMAARMSSSVKCADHPGFARAFCVLLGYARHFRDLNDPPDDKKA